jgi:hypothetical protein
LNKFDIFAIEGAVLRVEVEYRLVMGGLIIYIKKVFHSVKFKVLGFPLGLNCKALTFYFTQKRNGFPPGLRDRSRGLNVTKPLNSCDA